MRRDDLLTVWIREEPLRYPGRVSAATPGLELISADADAGGQDERVTYRSDAPGELVFARLAWPGYGVTVDGAAAEVRDGDAGLVTVAVPAGEHVVELRFTTPGLRLGAVVLGIAGLIVLAQSVLYWMGNRRRRDPAPRVESADEADALAIAICHASHRSSPQAIAARRAREAVL